MTQQEIIKYKVMRLLMNPEGTAAFINDLMADKDGALSAVLAEMKLNYESEATKAQDLALELQTKLVKVNSALKI